MSVDFNELIPSIPDYPQPGVVFRDITPLFADAEGLQEAVKAIADQWRDAGITKVVGPEARGFMIGVPVAVELGAGFIAARKPGKLPRETISATYELEYGTDTIEINADALDSNDKVLLLDDLIATGGTLQACTSLVQQEGAQLAGYACILELAFLNPRKTLCANGEKLTSLVSAS